MSAGPVLHPDDNPLFSLLPHCEDTLGIDMLDDQVQIVASALIADAAAHAPFESGLLTVSPVRPVLVVFERNLDIAPGGSIRGHSHGLAVTRFIERHFGSQAQVQMLTGDRRVTIAVADLPGADVPNVLFVPAQSMLEAGTDPRAMHHIVARLRQPDGCPWDRKQTTASLRNALINELYEAVDAIDAGDMISLAEELGDLYLLILMHAQIAHEAGSFSIEDVYDGIATKIVRRHPHVFGEEAASDAEDVVGIWNAVKVAEKAAGDARGSKDVDGEPHSMPALPRATRVLQKHPLEAGVQASPLLSAVAALVNQGMDPDQVLRDELRDHVTRNP